MRESHWFAALIHTMHVQKTWMADILYLRSFTVFHVHSEKKKQKKTWKLTSMAWEHVLCMSFYGDYSYTYLYRPSTYIVLSLL